MFEVHFPTRNDELWAWIEIFEGFLIKYSELFEAKVSGIHYGLRINLHRCTLTSLTSIDTRHGDVMIAARM